MESLIVITGSMGSGKTTTLGECSDLLTAADVLHSAIDLDTLGLAHTRSNQDFTLQNLAFVCRNFESIGVPRILVAAAIESRAELDRIREVVGATTVVTFRLRASVETMRKRVAAREADGVASGQYIGRVRTLEVLLDLAAVEDHTISTEGTSVSDVARTILRQANWLQA